MKKFLVLIAAAAALFLTSCASTSHQVGAKNSPAALMSVRFSNNTVDLLSEEEVETLTTDITNSLTVEGGFAFSPAELVQNGIDKALAKEKKSLQKQRRTSAFKNFTDTISGNKGLLDAMLDNSASTYDKKIEGLAGNNPYGEKHYLVTGENFVVLSPKDKYEKLNKEVKKATKCKTFVYVAVNVSTQLWRGDDKPTSIYAMTTVYIADQKGKVAKKINAVALSDQVTGAMMEDNPNILVEQIPDLIKKSANIAASNLHVKDGLFKIHIIKPDLREDVSSKDFAVLKQANIEN